MGTTGSRPALAAALILLALTGCGHSGPLSAAGRARAADGPAGSSGSSGPRGMAAAPAFCQSRQASVASVPGRMVPGSGSAQFVPLGVSASGRLAYVSAWTPRYSGVAALNLATGRLDPILRFGRPAVDQADGVVAGRWLVWAQTYSLTSLDRFTMYSFDTVTRRVRVIGHSLAGPGGAPWPSPWHAPAAAGHYAAWAQGDGPGGLAEIRLADLATGRVATIARGHLQPPFFDRGLLVWPQSMTPGSPTRLRDYMLASGGHTAGGAPASLPSALAGVRGTDMVVTDGTRTAYLSPDFTRLYYSPRPDVAARPVVRLPAGADFTDLALAPGTLAWTTSSATYLASTRTGVFVQVTPEYGYATGSASVMLITDAPAASSAHPPQPTFVIRPDEFSWPPCAAGPVRRS